MATDILAQKIDRRLTRWFETSAQALLLLFIVAILLTILTGCLSTLYDLRLILRECSQKISLPVTQLQQFEAIP